MTTNQPDRIDRIEASLERFITASDERMTRLEQSMERQSQESNERTKAHDERMKASDERLMQLSEKTDTRFNQLLTEADANRQVTFAMLEQMTALQEESKEIRQYLFEQQRNGNGDQPQP